ncbi:IclR family pca regulon transcriptional regulator [Peteryoungia aggregata LMG 23059]|uniref:IclR family pca regulon transcriptional regulator n=1 Tax=Peteryoungia aggregata LMG 23059 TaxID=1368425 RepID=A0ABU0G1Z6_9HYPH|nr:IclR family transcriptional regulator [Peteryoungia aggregata]MDQ0419341.1 IclR family pca regulon transcriptional regulator [Peteryoungia aggregata LMG 23059]
MAVGERDLMGGFAKGLKVLEAFGPEHQRLSITDAAELSGLDRATARRCLLTLAELGYADYDGKFFSLTPKILRIGHSWLSATPLPVLLQPHLDQLSERVGHSASASILDNTEIVYIARAAQKRVMSINLMPGSRLPAYSASMGRVLLAALPEAEVDAILLGSRLKAHTPHTLTDVPALKAEIGRVREQGYAVIDQELEIGLCSIAVPVRNDRGRVVAAINVGAPAAILPASGLPGHCLPAMLEMQARLKPLLP